MTKPYRAAYYVSPDQQSSVVLTRPEHSSLPDAELIAEALRGLEEAGVRDVVANRIVIGNWTA